MSKILGLDLGTNSIGWAIVDEEQKKIIGAGCRIFPMGVDNLGEGENEMSKNASRTGARGVRRQFYRRRLRKRYLIRILAKNNMCPVGSDQFYPWNAKLVFSNKLVMDWFKLNPYELRSKALEQEISLLELGRVFYHMIQRRGFLSNSRSAGSDDKEKGAIFKGDEKTGKIGISETLEHVAQSKTLGAYLNSIKPVENQPYEAGLERIRNRYTTRQMYIDEFEAIWEVQAKFHKGLTPELKTDIGGRKNEEGYEKDGAIFHQRPLRSQKHLVGNCTLEPMKPKCSISAIPFEQFRVYQWVNTVEYNGKKLDDTEREILAQQLFSKEKLTFKALRKALKKEDSSYQFNYKDDDKIVGTHTISNLSDKKFFGPAWFDFSEKEQEDIWHTLYFFDDIDKLKTYAKVKWGFSEDKAEKISKFNLKDKYASLSRKAINNILPFLKQGFTYDKAVALGGIKNAFGSRWNQLNELDKNLIFDNIHDIVNQGRKGGYIDALKEVLKTEFDMETKNMDKLYHHSANIEAKTILDKLPYGMEADQEIQSIRNPIVITALFELRKLVNEIIKEYGKPDTIKIELARDLKASKSSRSKTRSEQKRLETENDRVKGELEKLGQRITHDTLLKYKLWEECNKTCPYTGVTITVSELFTGKVQIEHIIPWSKSLNDSFMNKTLCFADENRAKGDKTPYQFYFGEQGEEKWDLVKKQALNCFKNKLHYPNSYAKFKQFVKTSFDEDFISRQLNDTRYISKEAKNYLSKIVGEKNIEVAPGQATANLRQKWGMNSILNDDNTKSREDHRHHAVDALVLTCTTRSHLQELAKWNRYDRQHDLKDFPIPWNSFLHDASTAIHRILVSHKKTDNLLTIRTNKVKKDGKEYKNLGIAARGQLHKETVFGNRQAPLSDKAFHARKPIESLKTKKQVEKVVDPKIRQLILKRIEEMGGFVNGKNIPGNTFLVPDENGIPRPQIFLPNKNGDPIPVRKVRLKENIGGAEKLKADVNQWVNPRNNHHVLIYKDENGELKEDVVTFWTAVERKKQGQQVTQLPPEDRKGEIVATLQINDLFLLGLKEEDVDWNVPDFGSLMGCLFKVQTLSSSFYEFRLHSDSTQNKDTNSEVFRRIQSFGDGKTGWKTFNPIKVNITPTGKIVKI